VTDGLRERKKAATRSALAAAALRLAVERGVEHVTVEDIAEAAGVSVRTFFNYFPTKEAAFVADDLERGRRFVVALRDASEHEAPWALLRRVAVETLGTADLPSREQGLKEQLIRSSPAVLAEVLGAVTALEQDLVGELTRRTPESSGPMQARLLANCVVAAVRAATETWLAIDAEPSAYVGLLGDAFDALAPAFDA
jgi:AcrR family transcriptional regulator